MTRTARECRPSGGGYPSRRRDRRPPRHASRRARGRRARRGPGTAGGGPPRGGSDPPLPTTRIAPRAAARSLARRWHRAGAASRRGSLPARLGRAAAAERGARDVRGGERHTCNGGGRSQVGMGPSTLRRGRTAPRAAPGRGGDTRRQRQRPSGSRGARRPASLPPRSAAAAPGRVRRPGSAAPARCGTNPHGAGGCVGAVSCGRSVRRGRSGPLWSRAKERSARWPPKSAAAGRRLDSCRKESSGGGEGAHGRKAAEGVNRERELHRNFCSIGIFSWVETAAFQMCNLRDLLQ